jgi:hypothetical protein
MASAGVGEGRSVAVGEDATTVDVAGVSGVDLGVVTGKRCLSGAQAEERTRKKQIYKPLYLIMWLYFTWLVITVHYRGNRQEFNGRYASTPNSYQSLVLMFY